MRTEAPDLSIVHDALHSVREELAHLFRGVCAGPASVGDFVTEIRAHLLEGERATAGDPDWPVARWLKTDGALAGLKRHPEDCGIFPRTDVFGARVDELGVGPKEFLAYASVEADDDGWVEVQRLVERGWLRQFESYSALRAFLGKDRVLRKFGLITKIEGDTVKKRLISDAKASGISAVASKRERVILPRFSGHCQRHTGHAGPVSRG